MLGPGGFTLPECVYIRYYAANTRGKFEIPEVQ